uniref:Uncharacterized protein n=1 Tax=Aegilops tauschii subsp. strangulata TaxID=200361 RepID=A0A453NI99_AEGTS
QKGLTFLSMNMYFEGYGYRGSTFEQTYRCYPASFIDKFQVSTNTNKLCSVMVYALPTSIVPRIM